LNSKQKNGLQSINFCGDANEVKERLVKNNILFKEEGKIITFNTLDGHSILFKNITYM